MYLLFDIGGTQTRLAISNKGRTLTTMRTFPTPRSFHAGMRALKRHTFEITNGARIIAAAGGFAGQIHQPPARAQYLHSLPDWASHALLPALRKAFRAPVLLENDAALAGLGEARLGSGRGHRIVAYITVSTGVGGVKIVDGEIDANVFGFEPGLHIIERPHARTKNALKKSFFEERVAGKGIARRYGKRGETLASRAAWDDIAFMIACGLHNVTVFWSPEVIILGGGIILNRTELLPLIRRYFTSTVKMFPRVPKLAKARLEDKAGLYGALELIRQARH